MTISFDIDCTPSEEVQVKVQKVAKKEKKEVKEKIPKERVNGLIPKTLHDRLVNIVLWHSELTMTDLLVKGLEMVAKEFPELPQHEGKLKVGRRAKKVETPEPVTTINVQEKTNEQSNTGTEVQQSETQSQEPVTVN